MFNTTLDREMAFRNVTIPPELTVVRYLCPILVYVLSKFIVQWTLFIRKTYCCAWFSLFTLVNSKI